MADKRGLCKPEEKIQLLDVGSCYNAFRAFDKFEAIGIDLCPANDSVYQCDFLELQITPSKDIELSTLSSPITALPGCRFHVVVFSLLLEYLPSSFQRFQCCLQAHALLVMYGLLLIITPDSHSQHRNAPMMKIWRTALESIGFSRWKYEKKEHIHCMAFRKISQIPDGLNCHEVTTKIADQLYIPQDFNDACYDDVEKNHSERTKSDDEMTSRDGSFLSIAQDELPFMFSFNDDDEYIKDVDTADTND